MKKTIPNYFAVAALLFIVLLSSCAKDGKDGTNGMNGTNSSPAYQLSFAVQPSEWLQSGTAGTAGAHIYYVGHDAHLNFDSVGHGAVLVYNQLPDSSLGALPSISYNQAGLEFTRQFIWQNGSVDLQIYISNSQFASESVVQNFIVVVIPGTKSAPVGVDLKDYKSVVAYYHPRKVN